MKKFNKSDWEIIKKEFENQGYIIKMSCEIKESDEIVKFLESEVLKKIIAPIKFSEIEKYNIYDCFEDCNLDKVS